MRNKIVFAVVGIFIVAYYLCNNFFSETILRGTYVVKKHSEQPLLADTPGIADTLVLFDNNKFASSYWGNGVYKLSHSLKGTKIHLIYKYEFGKARYVANVERVLFSNPRIIISTNDIYFMKIK